MEENLNIITQISVAGGGIWREPVRVREQVCAGQRLAQGGGEGGGRGGHPLLRDAERSGAQHARPCSVGLQGGLHPGSVRLSFLF